MSISNSSNHLGISPNNAYSLTNSSGGSGYAFANHTHSSFQQVAHCFDDQAISLEKFAELSEEKRSVITLMLSQMNDADFAYRTLIVNTLDIYGIIDRKEVVERKRKINNAINE